MQIETKLRPYDWRTSCWYITDKTIFIDVSLRDSQNNPNKTDQKTNTCCRCLKTDLTLKNKENMLEWCKEEETKKEMKEWCPEMLIKYKMINKTKICFFNCD